MFRSFTVKNFRCFRDLTVEPLARINLIAGKNNAGKTALLEALFLHMGANNPQLPWVLTAHRGIEQVSTDPREVWGWLFNGKRVGEEIQLTSLDQSEVSRTLRVSLTVPLETTQSSASGGVPGVTDGEGPSPALAGLWTTAIAARVLVLAYEDSAGRRGTASASVVPGDKGLELRLVREPTDPFPQAVFIPTGVRSPREDAVIFSKAVEVGQDEELLHALQILDPRLRRLMVLVTGGVPVIHGDLGAGPPVPLPLMGEGVLRLLSLLLSIANAPGGTVMIDEIENGLHYSALTDVWHVIAGAARRSDTQLFATTHSWECIRAAYEAFTAGGEDRDFRVFRLDRSDGQIRAVKYDIDMLGTALATGLEVR